MKKLLSTIVLLLFGLVFVGEGISQQPAAITVESISFALTTNPEPRATLIAKGPTGETLTYTGDVTFQYPEIGLCTPCTLPRAFDAAVLGQGFSIRLSDENRAVVKISQSNAPTIVMSPRFNWRNRIYTRTGRYAITATVEITNGVTTTAAAPQTALTGDYSADLFVSLNPNGRRTISFRRYVVSFTN